MKVTKRLARAPWWASADPTLSSHYKGTRRLPNGDDGRERWAWWHPIDQHWVAGTEIRIKSFAEYDFDKEIDETEAQTQRFVHDIRNTVTKREAEVLKSAREGRSPPEIARAVGTTVNNVYVTMSRMRKKAAPIIPEELLRRHKLI